MYFAFSLENKKPSRKDGKSSWQLSLEQYKYAILFLSLKLRLLDLAQLCCRSFIGPVPQLLSIENNMKLVESY